MFNQFDHLPQGLLDASTGDLLELLQRPTLIHLEGRNPQPLFISTLLHGNETTGFYALQEVLKHYSESGLPRSLSLFIGNVAAAAENVRTLPGQSDYNRIWPGTPASRSTETDIMQAVSNIMRAKKPFASIDIHNNTGKNPHYACVNVLSAHSLQIASNFSDITVYFTSPKGVQSAAFADFCPAVVLECGQSSDTDSVAHAKQFLESVIDMESIPGDHPEGIHLYHTVARVTIPEQFSVGTATDSDIILDGTFEEFNFRQLHTDAIFVEMNNPEAHLIVNNESNEEVSADFFSRQDTAMQLKKDVILSMYTTDATAIKQDCLCYFMERLHFHP